MVFIPMAVYYEHPVRCCLCPLMTTRGIREFDANKVPTEQRFCEACTRIVVEQYKAYILQTMEEPAATERCFRLPLI
jgi:hypothetical protein